MAVKSEELVRAVRERCAQHGLDLLQPFAVGWYNDAVDSLYRLPDYGRPSTLGLLIGNTRALWAHFVAALRAQPQRLTAAHPLDAFVAEGVGAALRPIAPRCCEVRWAHEAPPRRVAMQRLAHVAGLAYLSPTHLSVHPTYGPWIGLRAAVVVDVNGPTGGPPELRNPCLGILPDPICMAKFREAATVVGILASHTAVGEHWQRWVAVRDACAVGRTYRYSDEQIRYHYTKDVRVLSRMVEGVAV